MKQSRRLKKDLARALRHGRSSAPPQLRGYSFRCICGLEVSGIYRLSKIELALQARTGKLAPLNKKKVVCRVMRGAAAGQKWSQTAGHDVGCGRTLEDVEQELARRKQDGVALWAKVA